MATIPFGDWCVPGRLPDGLDYIRGQQERGDGGFEHWQLVVHTTVPQRLTGVKSKLADTAHLEPTRSSAALEYVWKLDSRVGEPFELGVKPFDRKSKSDWASVLTAAQTGEYGNIPPDIVVRCYSSLKLITKDNLKPEPVCKTVWVYWGPTGTGKSRRAWSEATFDAFPKDPMTKFWDGYQGQKNVVMDEFRGDISISHLLRWLDRYPVIIEAKHGACCLKAENFWITSNIHPSEWYPSIDGSTKEALLRRLTIVSF